MADTTSPSGRSGRPRLPVITDGLMEIDPLPMSGPWKAGYSLAQHTLSAEFLGYNEQGYPKFDTVRSEIGERLYQLKYQGDSSAVQELAAAAAEFVANRKLPVDAVVPLPPSRKRAVQPVVAIAEAVAKRLNVAYDSQALRKIKETPELKSLVELEERKAALVGAFAASREFFQGRVVLLFDDLFRSGASMQEATRSILDGGGAKAVYALALTRTRTHR